MERLFGSRIVLREYTWDDGIHIHRWRNDRSTTLWMGRKFREPVSLEETVASLGRVILEPSADSLYFAIADGRTRAYLGGIDLTSIDRTDKNAVMSIVIGEEANRNKGYGSEAIQLLLAHAFERLGLHRISLRVSAGNGPALRCYLKNGFRIEGRQREQLFVDWHYFDLVYMGILASE